jgi:hypothetical protein
MSTVNDLELNEKLTRVAQLHPLISQCIRENNLRSAAWKASEMEDLVRKINWRIHELLRGKEAL